MKIDPNKMYVVEPTFLNGVVQVMERLYHHDFKRLDADESRDLANMLNARLHSLVWEYEEHKEPK